MPSKGTSSQSRAQVRQYPPGRCARCGKRLKDGAGQWVPGTGPCCTRCAQVIGSARDRDDGIAAKAGS